MSKAGRIMVYLLSLSVIIVFLTMFQNQAGAQEVISLDPVAFYGERLPDTALANLTGRGDWVVIRLNESAGGNNQVNVANVNGNITTQITPDSPKTVCIKNNSIIIIQKHKH